MQIECPKCFKANYLFEGAKIACRHCQEDMSGHQYKVASFISATTALVLGLGGGYVAEKHLLGKHIYPVAVSYAIIESCVNTFQTPMNEEGYRYKRNLCICAFENTAKNISYSDYQKNSKPFRDAFYGNAACQ